MDDSNGQREDKNLLTSWKEIATYLGRDIRTCLRWEKSFGLPIHRLDPGSEKSRVFAYRNELDEWLHRSQTGRPGSKQVSTSASRRLLILSFFLLAITATGLLLLEFILPGLGSREAADFGIKHSSLIIYNEKGKELWRYDTGLENLWEEKDYRRHFQFKKSNHVVYLPYIIIKDLDRDGHQEVLFSIQTQDETKEGDVFCFNRKGRPLWHFRAGRQMKYGDKIYSRDYRINGLLADDLDGDGQLEIIVLSVHRPSWPCQLALLDSRGNLKGEYWNAGYFNDATCVDLNADGVKEIVAGGNNNESGTGCLAVFEPKSISGGSPQSGPDFRCPDLKAGSELVYILLPRTDVDLADSYPADGVAVIDVLENRRIQARTSLSDLYYHFSLDFYVTDVILSHGFIQAHEKARLAGKIQSLLDKDYETNLLRGIRYWDGDKWSPTPPASPGKKQD